MAVGVGVGVAVCRGVYVVAGVRVLPRLGAVVDLVGVGVVRRGGVYDGVADGPDGADGVAGTDGAAGDASSAGSADVIVVSWLVGRGVPVCRMTNHPMPASRTRADNDARRGPATPLLGDRLWFVMLSSLAQGTACQLATHEHFTKL